MAAACPGSSRLRVARHPGFGEWAALREAAYFFRSDIADWSDRPLWKTYIQLTQAEAAFRLQKVPSRVRPIGYKHAERVAAHILVYFHAFLLSKSLEMCRSRAGLCNSPRTVLEEFADTYSHDIVLPTITRGRIRPRCFAPPQVAPPRVAQAASSAASASLCPNACA